MGMGACAVEARTAASLGVLSAVAPDFQPALDVPNGGVLCALPALLAFMALARLNTLESLRHCAPGEWGKLPGLDRAPEVRTLRQKIHQLAHDGQPAQWGADLCGQWMAAAPEQAGVLYVDGHVRVYHGGQTQLPRHPVARQKLCLRATVDYWVNAMDGQPFFAVNQAADPGLIQVLEQDILPRLLRDVPGQPDEEALEGDPLLLQV